MADVVGRGEKAIALFGAQRVLLNPDCGFATFADNPIVTAAVAEAQLVVLAQARTCSGRAMAGRPYRRSTAASVR